MMGKNNFQIILCAAVIGLSTFLTFGAGSQAQSNPYRGKSYAIVVGINSYSHRAWTKLDYAVKDAEGIAQYLYTQGFEVITLYERDATRQAIVAALEDRLAPILTENDRIVFFFAGHGKTSRIGDNEYGHLVPYDGDDLVASLVPMYQIRDLALMSPAKHQLFIFDACFGGLIAMRGSTAIRPIDPRTTPDYIEQFVKRRARQVLTAGGADQSVADRGPDGHSVFTGELLKALKDGLADRDGDGYITFTELAAYIQTAASRPNQTPGSVDLPGHQQGEFIFVNPRRTQLRQYGSISGGAFRSENNIYELLKTGKRFYQEKNYSAAQEPFFQAAEMGSTEAMVFLGRMYWSGWGVRADPNRAIELFVIAAERGELIAMESLVNIYSRPGKYHNPTETARWKSAADQALRLTPPVLLYDTSGKPDIGEPTILVDDIRVPAAPTGLTVQ